MHSTTYILELMQSLKTSTGLDIKGIANQAIEIYNKFHETPENE